MKILISVVAGALMGVSAVAGAPETSREVTLPSTFAASDSALASPDVAGIRPVLDALRSGDAVYAAITRESRADYVPPRPPL
jgi:hypothetical protein